MTQLPRIRARRWAVAGLAVGLPLTAIAILPFPAVVVPDVYDYASYLFLDDADCQGDHSDLPPNVDCGGTGDFETTNYRDTTRIDTAHNPQELYGVVGPSTNLAWRITTGRPDVVIAVIDDGVQWDQSVSYLNRKYYINRGELPLPSGGPNAADTIFGGYDVNGDGVFNSLDYAGTASDLNGNGFVDPQDLIRSYSDSVDDDGNGYVDDIAGWDFYENDNDPNDDVDFGHGNGRSRDAVGEAGIEDGQCPNCMVMPLRVGDSFIADVNHYGEAAAYAADNGVYVIEDALGTLNHTSFGQAGTDYAYYHGVIINASEADEAAGHHNWPAAYEHTMVVNAIGDAGIDQAAVPNSFLHLLGCTNFGGYSFVSIPGVKCSSEAAGRSAGVSGLLVSAALNAIDRGDMTRYIRDDGSLASFPLSGEEMKQLWRLAADDIDFSSPCPDHAFCDEPPGDVPFPVAPANNYAINTPDSIRYQSVRGWDYFTGYGRENAYRLVAFIGIEDDPVAGSREYTGPASTDVGSDAQLSAQDRIPPEADITAPRWWGQFPYRPDNTLLDPQDPGAPSVIVVEGRAAANRVTAAGGTFDYILEWAPHVQGQKFPVGSLQAASGSEEMSGGPWSAAVIATGLTQPVVGELGRIPVANLVSSLTTTPNPFDPATDPTSEFQPERYAIRLRLRVIAHPTNAADDMNNEAVMQKQIDVYPASETVIRDDLGVSGRIADGSGSPSFRDLDGDGVDELLVFSGDGLIHAYTDVASGAELPGWPVTTSPFHGVLATGSNGYTNGGMPTVAYDSILAGTPGVADLDDDGHLEVVVADLEGRVHVFEADGSPRAGFPVQVDLALSRQAPCSAATIPACDEYAASPKQDLHNKRDPGISSVPAIGDLDPLVPGLEIVVGSHDNHVYAWHHDGTPVPGWPVVLRDPAKVATMNATTHNFTLLPGAGAVRDGTKVIVSPSLGDLDGDGDLEVVVGVNEQYAEDPNAALAPELAALGYLVVPGNARIYALHGDGASHPATPAQSATAHTQDQAYVSGWPVPLAIIQTDLLPDVGTGTNGQSPLADIDGNGDLEIVTASAAGPGYILNHDGSSFLGTVDGGKYRTLATSGGAASDVPSYIAVGALGVASLDGGVHLSVLGPGGGLKRVLDIVIPAQQLGGQDHFAFWNATTGSYEPNSPIVVNDLQFFTGPIAGDISGDGLAEGIQGSAVSDTVAAGLGVPSAAATRYHNGGWTVSSAGLGHAPLGAQDEGTLSLATTTREGYLRLYPTSVAADSAAACTALSQWPQFGHDARNSGNYNADAERPYPLRDVAAPAAVLSDSVDVTLTATGDDRACGSALTYQVRSLPGNVANPDWLAAAPLSTIPVGAAAGASETITVSGLAAGTQTLLVRAYDDAGNGSAVSRVVVLPEPSRALALAAASGLLFALARKSDRRDAPFGLSRPTRTPRRIADLRSFRPREWRESEAHPAIRAHRGIAN
jgi:hypothetical protein